MSYPEAALFEFMRDDLADDGFWLYLLDYSVALDAAATTHQYFTRTYTTSATCSGLIVCKRGKLGAVSPLLGNKIYFNASDQLVAFGSTSTAVFRDPTAHYIICWGPSGVWVNGVEVIASLTTADLASAAIGYDGTNYFDGVITRMAVCSGTDEAANFTGIKRGVTYVKGYSVPYGAAGFDLRFANSGSLGLDSSGNGNNFTPQGSPVQSIDTPTNNHCTLNPYDKNASLTLTNGNTRTSGGNQYTVRATFEAFDGLYFEMSAEAVNYLNAGLGTKLAPLAGALTSSAYFYGAYYHSENNLTYIWKAGSLLFQVSGTGWGTGNVWRFAYKNGNFWIGNASGWLNSSGGFTGDPAAGTNPTMTGIPTSALFPIFNNQSATFLFKSGATGFTYTVPTGFLSPSAVNLVDETIDTSGSFTGNASTDGPCVFTNGPLDTLTINGNAVTWGTHAIRIADGFKIITSSTSYNSTGTNTWTGTTDEQPFKYANAQ